MRGNACQARKWPHKGSMATPFSWHHWPRGSCLRGWAQAGCQTEGQRPPFSREDREGGHPWPYGEPCTEEGAWCDCPLGVGVLLTCLVLVALGVPLLKDSHKHVNTGLNHTHKSLGGGKKIMETGGFQVHLTYPLASLGIPGTMGSGPGACSIAFQALDWGTDLPFANGTPLWPFQAAWTLALPQIVVSCKGAPVPGLAPGRTRTNQFFRAFQELPIL